MAATGNTDDREQPDQALRRIALRARVRALTDGAIDPDPAAIDGSIGGLVADGRAFYQTADPRGLGPALRWASSVQADRLAVIAEADVAGGLARRAGLLDVAAIGLEVEVFSAEGPSAAPAQPSELAAPPAIPEAHRPYASMMAEAGARPVDDHGMLVAEVAGLEVARVIDDEETGGPRLSVGVGQADRELQSFIHGHLDDDANLRRAIAAVARHRRPGSAAHPLSRLARQRWLRSVLIDDPGLVGLSALEALAPLRSRETLLGQEPTAAVTRAAGSGDAGDAGAVVVCSVGVDLDLLPEAADYRQRDAPEAELVVVVPERDRRLVAGAVAGAVPRLRLVSIDAPWDHTA